MQEENIAIAEEVEESMMEELNWLVFD